MKLLSVNVGRPQAIKWGGKTVRSSIFKSPVDGERKVSFLNIEGDEQSDLRVHGGINKAVYAYDASHYDHWKEILPGRDWPWGLFGENLTTAGLPDDDVKIGDIYQIGSAQLQAVQPRFPCLKLNVRFGLPDMMERFVKEKRNGIYFKVIKEGVLRAGQEITLLRPSPFDVTVQQYVDCYYAKEKDKAFIRTVLSMPFLPESQHKTFNSFA